MVGVEICALTALFLFQFALVSRHPMPSNKLAEDKSSCVCYAENFFELLTLSCFQSFLDAAGAI